MGTLSVSELSQSDKRREPGVDKEEIQRQILSNFFIIIIAVKFKKIIIKERLN